MLTLLPGSLDVNPQSAVADIFFLLRTVSPEGVTMSEFLPPVLPNQLNSADRWRGQKMCLTCRPDNYICGVVATLFDARTDVSHVESRW